MRNIGGINTKLLNDNKRDSNVDMKSFLRKNKTASFWMDDTLKDGYGYLTDYSRMSLMIKNFKAIRNFVSILTGKNIPVKYSTKTDTYFTNGESITISADINAFDITCGASLHEASHILLTNFNIYKNIGAYFMAHYNAKNHNFLKVDIAGITAENFQYCIHHYPVEIIEVIKSVKNISNWIEDRRIDNFIITNAPGYKGYYDALYKKYFYNKEINELIAKTCNEVEMKAYIFYIVNSMNKNLNVKALPGLKEIVDLIDLKNIKRLDNTLESFNLAIDILSIIYDNIPIKVIPPMPTASSDSNNNSSKDDKTKSKIEELLDKIVTEEKKREPEEEEPEEEPEEEYEEVEEEDPEEDDEEDKTEDEAPETSEDDEIEESSNGNGNGNSDSQDEKEEKKETSKEDKNDSSNKSSDNDSQDDELSNDSVDDSQSKISPKDFQKIKDILRSQEEFIDHETKKKNTTENMASTIKNLTESDVDIASVGGVEVMIIKANQTPYEKWSDLGTSMIKNFDEKKSAWIPTGSLTEKQIQTALYRGTQLGKKLQIRNEERSTKYSRLDHGKIENRQIFNLGYGNTEIFFQTRIDKYKNTHLHISIDASGSMQGPKFEKALMTTISIIKAASMTQNISTMVDLRASEGKNNICVIIYDSKKDNINKVKSTFRRVFVAGCTPEAIVFNGLLNKGYYLPSTQELNSYFLNFSDGAPTDDCDEMYKYEVEGEYPRNSYNKAIINKIRELGIEVISYFIDNYYDENSGSYQTFKFIYGKDARLINHENLSELAKTMNDKFLAK